MKYVSSPNREYACTRQSHGARTWRFSLIFLCTTINECSGFTQPYSWPATDKSRLPVPRVRFERYTTACAVCADDLFPRGLQLQKQNMSETTWDHIFMSEWREFFRLIRHDSRKIRCLQRFESLPVDAKKVDFFFQRAFDVLIKHFSRVDIFESITKQPKRK